MQHDQILKKLILYWGGGGAFLAPGAIILINLVEVMLHIKGLVVSDEKIFSCFQLAD